MRLTCFRIPAAALILIVAAVFALQAEANNELVKFPGDHAEGVHYATVERGGITQELFTGREAVDAAKRGEPFPHGTMITLVDHRGGGIHRYVVMEKRAGWGELNAAGVRAGDWLFREFAPDGTPNLAEDGTRCMSCHQSQAGQDFVFTVQQMRSAD